MGVLANFVWLPLVLVGLVVAQSNETAITNDRSSKNSVSSSTIATTSIAPDVVISGDLNKAARVERMSADMDPSLTGDAEALETGVAASASANADTDADGNTDATTTPKTDGQYDVIDVLEATSAGVGKAKSGQTTRIYTTGDVNDDFWLKHLGDDFKHAIHLQVGGTNDDYNRIINQTSGGVHEEVHHEYLPGAERPAVNGYGQSNVVSHLNLGGEAMALKNNYLMQQQQQNGYIQQQQNQEYNSNGNNNNRLRDMYNGHNRHRHTHTDRDMHIHTHTNIHKHTHANTYPAQAYTRGSKPRHSLRSRYNSNQSDSGHASSIINSSEDTLHTAQSQAAPSSSASASVSASNTLRHVDTDNPLPFKSPFNDYGSRPTRDLTYLLYKRGL